MEGFTYSDIKLCCKSVEIKNTLVLEYQKTFMSWNRIESPKVNSQIYEQSISAKGTS